MFIKIPIELSMFLYLISSVLFILSLRGLSSASTAKRGNIYGMLGMGIAIVTTMLLPSIVTYTTTIVGIAVGGGIGYIIAKKINMTALPQLVAAFHSLIGLAAVFIAFAVFYNPEAFDLPRNFFIGSLIEMSLGAGIGAITFTGSLVAFGKLQGILKGKPLSFCGQHKLNLLIAISILCLITYFAQSRSAICLFSIVMLSFILGLLLILPIGGADMPVIVSMLNSYSGWAAAGIGLTLQNNLLIITGALVGTSGAILSHIMCKGMNRSLWNVIFGGITSDSSADVTKQASNQGGNVKLCSPEDAAFIIKNAGSIIVVPGYGMAVAQAQHAIKEMADLLKNEGASIRFAIHPVAGRMPGHMNVLLAEANIDYEDVLEIDEINHDFGNTDVAIVIGANDITNPAAKNDPSSPIYGMPVLDVDKAKTILFVKRSLGSGYAGIDNPLFYQNNTMMVLGDAKKVIESVLKSMKED